MKALESLCLSGDVTENWEKWNQTLNLNALLVMQQTKTNQCNVRYYYTLFEKNLQNLSEDVYQAFKLSQHKAYKYKYSPLNSKVSHLNTKWTQ